MIAPVKWVELRSDYLRVAERAAGSPAKGLSRWGAKCAPGRGCGVDFRVGAGNQVAVYGERVAPVANSVNPTPHED